VYGQLFNVQEFVHFHENFSITVLFIPLKQTNMGQILSCSQHIAEATKVKVVYIAYVVKWPMAVPEGIKGRDKSAGA